MKNEILKEVKEDLTIEMKEIFERICNYYNEPTQLIKEYFKNS